LDALEKGKNLLTFPKIETRYFSLSASGSDTIKTELPRLPQLSLKSGVYSLKDITQMIEEEIFCNIFVEFNINMNLIGLIKI
jgi:hypothetical protein